MNLCVGMFGTCGDSKWREIFIQTYTQLGISFYNPQRDDWKPECAVEEAEHLASDSIILFPVTSETYGFGSLAETGFSIVQALKNDDRRDFIILVDNFVNIDDGVKSVDSVKTRKLVLAHLAKITLANVYLVDTLDEMLSLSIVLHNNQAILKEYQDKFNPSKKLKK